MVYANIRGKDVNAKTVEVVVYANTRDKDANAKTAEILLERKTDFMK